MRGRSCATASLSLAFAFLPLAAFGQVRVGVEFQVNAYTSDEALARSQSAPSLASDADGDFVVAWGSQLQDGSNWGIFTRRYSSAGASLVGEFQANSFTTDEQRLPAVATDADGDFAIAWQSYQEGASYGVFTKRFTNTGGALLSGDLHVNTFTLSSQLFPVVANESNGDFVVVWQSLGQDGASNGIFGLQFTSTGSALNAPEFQVNTYTVNDQRYPSVSMDGDGDFVVVWQSYQDGSLHGIFAQRFSSSGAPIAAEFQVNVYTTNGQSHPWVAVDSDGDFVVAWESPGQDGQQLGVFARRFASGGFPVGGEFLVNSYTISTQAAPRVAIEANGDFVIAWQSLGQDGAQEGIFARAFTSLGVPVSGAFQVNTHTLSYQLAPSVAVNGPGFVIAWESSGQDDVGTGIFAQRFLDPIPLDIDGNGSTEPLTDGLLVLRFLFGFTGNTLVSQAVGEACTRCSASTIEPYLAGLGALLDVDGNVEEEPLTDGLLLLRYLFGFGGPTLINDAVGENCSRCDSVEIGGYLAGLTS